jgi:membrane fusion protein, multidrug efflux system
MSMKLRYVTLTPLLLVFIFWGCNTDQQTEQSAEQARAVAGYEVKPMDLSREIKASALAEAENVITIAARMEGLITGLHVREGDRISVGDTLLTFDTQELQAELNRANAELELAEAAFNRAEQLFERETIARAEFEETRAELQRAESEANLLETRISFGTIISNGNRVVLNRYVEQGDAVSTTDALIRIADTRKLVARFGIPERDFVYLEQGQNVGISVDAYPNYEFTGTIQRLYPSSNEESRLFTAEIALPAEQGNVIIRPGFLVRTSIFAERREDVLAVPSESLLASEENERFVYVINEENRMERRDVQTGIERRNWTEIVSGLETGDVVVGANPATLREDLLVQVSRWIEPDLN